MDTNNQPLRPVQVVLDGDRFLKTPDRPPGGSHKDFFAGDDVGFAQHKNRVRADLEGFAETLQERREPVGFVHVDMRESALAKSHRPLDRLFSASNKFTLVGGDADGQLIVQGTPRALKELSDLIEERAESTPRMVTNKKTGREEPRASEVRSELGAIGDLRLHTREDRLKFDPDQALAILRQPNVIGSYIIDLFRLDPSLLSSGAVTKTIRALLGALSAVPGGMIVRPVLPEPLRDRLFQPTLALSVRLLSNPSRRVLQLPRELEAAIAEAGAPAFEGIQLTAAEAAADLDPARHRKLLNALAEQTLVRSIEMPFVVDEGTSPSIPLGAKASLSLPAADFDHPILGVVDGGIAALPALTPWIAGTLGLVPEAERNVSHGTFIAGLAAGAYQLNPHLADYVEAQGVKLYDLDIFPRRDLRSTYYIDHHAFLDQLDTCIEKARSKHGVRVFNFSFACGGPQPGSYTVYAEGFDAIARKHDVIFVISAGNLTGADTRPPWPADAGAAVQMLAGQSQPQSITPPGEAFHGLTVGAVNPPGFADHPVLLPTTYTRRGPGTGYSRKPDLAHIGGVTPDTATGNRTGLSSLAPDGTVCDSLGTSYAAPLVGVTLATLDQRLLRRASRELLHALMIHQARREHSLTGKQLSHIAPEFVGYGVPPRADAMLVDDPSAITIVFDQVLPAGRILEFDFSWPQSLVTPAAACRGAVDLTVVYTPPIDRAFNDEALRVELDAHLRQQVIDPDTGEISWAGQLDADGTSTLQGMLKREKEMLRNGVKWSPVKRLHAAMPKGRGASSDWKLVVEPLVRKGDVFPGTGVKFAALLTIRDIAGMAPVHDEMRNHLVNRGISLADIQVAARVRQVAA
ncbi:S8 family serine peptidase [Hyphomicrobium sp. xq]|uniref:S8 family serine peptidase n=1 Tax=Hyphomicrobium album TaxID=2665159 RepID=A0A6I3KIX2_9HYPH|nr:S8 family serine peptidase [Hyphomicrobium album]MTD94349.1 S8 family serine peptidase [Hyphomicrobium album]